MLKGDKFEKNYLMHKIVLIFFKQNLIAKFKKINSFAVIFVKLVILT
jgi:hypothetical protein